MLVTAQQKKVHKKLKGKLSSHFCWNYHNLNIMMKLLERVENKVNRVEERLSLVEES